MLEFYDEVGNVLRGTVVKERRREILVNVRGIGQIWIQRDDVISYAA